MLIKKIAQVVFPLFLWQLAPALSKPEFYSRAADEYVVDFSAVIKTDFSSLEKIQNLSDLQKQDYEEYVVKPTVKFLFGPLTNRSMGGIQKGFNLYVLWANAYVENGAVIIPYNYSGQWLVNKKIKQGSDFVLPLPLNERLMKTVLWKNCSDQNPDHQDYGSLWYYWDPERSGCDHQLGKEYQIIKPQLTKKSQQTSVSSPEYEKMIRNKKVSMTFAFGYVEDPADAQPFSDSDYGMGQFRSFLSMVRNNLRTYNFKETDILEQEYLGSYTPSRKIGSRFQFEKQGLSFEVKVVASGSIDQMELFTKSFSHDHDAFFGWFGHSRVGNGFDAFKFNSLMQQNKLFYSLTADYQMIYWAGCNSYSYYTKPFFDFKSNLIAGDINGTKSLDIISNGLPSYFSLNAVNAEVLLRAIVNIEQRVTYQAIVNQIEQQSRANGIFVLVNVLGDEDNM